MTEKQKSEILNLWEHPDSYWGPEFPDYYIVYGQHRDSDLVVRANWRTFMDVVETFENEKIESDTDTDGEWFIETTNASHWAVGWVEGLLVHKDAPQEMIEKFEGMVAALTDYPLLDDSLYYEMEHSEAGEYWDDMSEDQKMDFCEEEEYDTDNATRPFSEIDDNLYERITEINRD